MMPSIAFVSHDYTLDLLNPLRDFAPDRQTVQLRSDPLLGHTAVYNPLAETGAKIFIGETDRALIEQLKAESAPKCFFCPERIESTAKFPPELITEGRIRVGEAVLFPNLFALAPHHAVAVVSNKHFLELDEFTPNLIADALRAAQQYVMRVFAFDASAHHVAVCANYLFPAGASVMHPHFQVLITREPYAHAQRLLEACERYQAAHGTSYHPDLVETERASGERYIGHTGSWHWLSAYAPLASNEILAVHPQQGDFALLTEDDIAGLARGLSATLKLYGALGYLSFNFTLYARRDPGRVDGFNCLLRCMTRQNPYANYRTDDFFLQKGLQTELILTLPEKLAQRAAEFFSA